MDYLLMFSQRGDVGRYLRSNDVDLRIAAVVNLQHRGNCALDHYCKPDNETIMFRTYSVGEMYRSPFQGSLPGTCQRLLPAMSACLSSASCENWAGPSNNVSASLDPRRTRCWYPDEVIIARNFTQGGTCEPLGDSPVIYDWLWQDGPSTGYSTVQKYLLLSSGILLMMALLGYVRYKHQARERQRREALRQQSLQNQPTYRPPAPEDDGLPSYGQHTRDARVTGPASEEIGMYGFPTDPPYVARYYPPPGTLPPTPTSTPPPPHVMPAPPFVPSANAYGPTTSTNPTTTVATTVAGPAAIDPLTGAALTSGTAAAARGTQDRESTIDPFKDQSTTGGTTATSSPRLSIAKKEHPLAADEDEENRNGRPGSSRSLSTTQDSTTLGSSRGDGESEENARSLALTGSSMPPQYSSSPAAAVGSPPSSSSGSVAMPPTASTPSGER
ncbi:hypothetical protein BGW41_006915 [Actinomortierella wolfii]|nr:hypothetical protein BGW41_006915 [Actinomortierella wolfii]